MSKPFRFSMRRMLGAITSVGVAFLIFARSPDCSSLNSFSVIIPMLGAAFAAIGLGIGVIIGRPIAGAISGMIAGLAVGLMAIANVIGP
jgi:hypothetical protein